MRKFSLFYKTTSGFTQMGTILELEIQGRGLLWVGGNQNPIKGG